LELSAGPEWQLAKSRIYFNCLLGSAQTHTPSRDHFRRYGVFRSFGAEHYKMNIEMTLSGRKCLRDKAFPQRKPVRDTSIEALQSQDEETTAHRRNRIWRFIAERGGATCWEVEQAFGALHQTVSAAISNLSADGVLVDTGERRPTGSGRKAIVWGVV
jgi:hypothetical protein